MIDLRQLQALAAVSRTGSVSRAAIDLGWSQPSVDYHLRNLDRLCGTPLLVRTTRGSTLTEAGTIMLERATRILTLTDRALDDVRAHARSGVTKLAFGTFPTAAAAVLPSIVHEANSVGIHLDTTLEEIVHLVAHVNDHAYDAVLLYSVPGHRLPFAADIRVREVHREPLRLAVPVGHPLAGRRSVDAQTLLGLDGESWLLGTSNEDPVDSVVVDAFAEAGRDLAVEFRTDDYSVMLGMVAAEMVIGVVPQLATVGSHPGVALVPIDDPRFARTLLLVTPKAPAGPAAAEDLSRLTAIVTGCLSRLGMR